MDISNKYMYLRLASVILFCFYTYLEFKVFSDHSEGECSFCFGNFASNPVRVLFHNLISPISIYTRRAFWARLSMLHVIEFNLWPKSSALQSIEK